jgi:hypothetical protein
MFLGVVHSFMFLENTQFLKLDLFPSSGTMMEYLHPLQRLTLPLSNRVDVPSILRDDGNRSIFVVFLQILLNGQSPKTYFSVW